MKILHVSQFFHPLKGYQETSLCLEQSRLGHDVAFIASSDMHYWAENEKDAQKLLDHDKVLFEKYGIKINRIKRKKIISERVFPESFFQIMKNENPDILFLHGVSTPMTLMALYYLKKLNKKDIKLIIDDHMVAAGSFNKYSKQFYKIFRQFYSRYIKYLGLKVDKWVGVSDETVQFMKENYGITEPIEMIPLGFNGEFCYRDMVGGQQWLVENNLPLNKNYILYIGKCDKFKKPVDLIEPVARFLKDNKEYAFLIVGEGTAEYFETLNNNAKNAGIEDRFFIKPPVNNVDIRKVFSIAEVAVWPHGSSMAMLEAMKCGCPVIAGDLDVNKERLDNGRGIMFQKDNFEDLYHKLLTVADKKAEITAKAEEWVKDYTWENINKAFLKF